ncbi:hypothetical protein ACFFGV_03985 [Pontibacillus salicampi]|uniref:Uncharacterized protein n=1 Tax=Pontibacillus salicampi TaxID=1449801 RepID=A0ABV6LKB7_9BACI
MILTIAEPKLVSPGGIISNIEVVLIDGLGTITLNGIPCPTIIINLNLGSNLVGTIMVEVREIP